MYPIKCPHVSYSTCTVEMEGGYLVEKFRDFMRSQIQDDQKWDTNMKLVRAVGMFAGSILLMRNFGDLMAI